MHTLRTAILEHRTADGVHHDWLIEDPRLPNPKAPDAKLWTARITPPPQNWQQLKRFDLKTIPPHRRAYLAYQGPVSNNRGHVQRLMSGTCVASFWSEERILLTMHIESVTLDLQITRCTSDHWIATHL